MYENCDKIKSVLTNLTCKLRLKRYVTILTNSIWLYNKNVLVDKKYYRRNYTKQIIEITVHLP